MTKAQELWLKTGGWENHTPSWEHECTRWYRDALEVHIEHKTHKAYANRHDKSEKILEVLPFVRLLNKMRGLNVAENLCNLRARAQARTQKSSL